MTSPTGQMPDQAIPNQKRNSSGIKEQRESSISVAVFMAMKDY
jgi:hypothetical protein